MELFKEVRQVKYLPYIIVYAPMVILYILMIVLPTPKPVFEFAANVYHKVQDQVDEMNDLLEQFKRGK